VTESRDLGHRASARPAVLLAVIVSAAVAAWILMSLALGLVLPRANGGPLPMVLGGISLVVGLGALVVACVLLFKAFRLWALLLLVPLVLALSVGVYSLSIAFAAVYPPHASSDASPAGGEQVSMAAEDGVRLSGWYLPSRNGAAVVLRHGANSTASDTVRQAQVLNEAGYGVLSTDARGHGASDGQGMDLGWFGDPDTRAAVDFLAARVDVDPDRIAVIGLSMGGEEAIGAAGEDDRIKAVVAEGATGRTAADKAWLAEEYGFAGVVQGVLDAVTYGLINGMTTADPPPPLTESIREASPTRFLLIAGGALPDEQRVAQRLAAVDRDRVEVWVVPHAGHVQGLGTAPAEWRDRVIGFLDQALAEEPG
jgi:pimeloyl-ACP methyl ester carboxylesterase